MSFRQRVLRQSEKDISLDTESYERVWANTLTSPGNRVALAHLATGASELGEGSSAAGRPVQLHLTRQELIEVNARRPAWYGQAVLPHSDSKESDLKGQHDDGRWRELMQDANLSLETQHSVQSLDLLFGQAMMMNPILQTKVQQIALASAGMFLVLSAEQQNPNPTRAAFAHSALAYVYSDMPPGYRDVIDGYRDMTPVLNTMSREVEDTGALSATNPAISFVAARAWPRQGALKSVDRVIEKLVRSYRGNVSLVCDIVRQCIVFESVEDLCGALEAIKNDREIEVVRVKNRMTSSYNAKNLSCSYRDVLLNVTINSPVTRELGVFRHICELQLILKSFMMHKTKEGHKRYVEYRNKRCE